MKSMKLINLGLIIVLLIFVSIVIIPTSLIIFGSSQPKILDCYPRSEDRNAPIVFESDQQHEIYAYVQEVDGINVSQIKVDILALESVPHMLRLVSNWNVTWYQITTYNDSAGIERPYFFKSIANTSWSELNWRYDWGDGEIVGNHTDMVAFKAVGTVEVTSEGGVVIEMTSNDGMLVSLDGTILKPHMWFPHERMRIEKQIFLGAGLHNVEVLWFEKEGKALSEFKMYPVGWSVQETIHLSKGEVGLDPEGKPYIKYTVTWTPNLLSGSNYQFDWILEDKNGVLDKKTTYLNIYRPVDGYFTVNGEVVTNSTVEVSKPFVEFWFYSKSRGDEVSSVIIEVSDSNGPLPDQNGRILLNEIERDQIWYGRCTLPQNGDFSVKGSFQSIRGGEWIKMFAGLKYKSKLSPTLIQFLINGGTIVIILVGGYSVFYLIRKHARFNQIKNN